MKREMFNIYYINHTKAYEIAMLIDNTLPDKIRKLKATHVSGEGSGEFSTTGTAEIPLVGKYLPSIDVSGNILGNRSKEVEDSFNVVSTKSTLLATVMGKVQKKEIGEKGKTAKNGDLIKIQNVGLKVLNFKEIFASKTLLSGLVNQNSFDGIEMVDLPALLGVFLKDSSYIFSGQVDDETVIFKVPMQAENEMESQYNISDLEIGTVSVIGIYRGKFEASLIKGKINQLMDLQNKMNENNDTDDTDDDNSDIVDGSEEKGKPTIEYAHYIDIIAIVQELNLG